MACDKKRWDWLLMTYRSVNVEQHNKIIQKFGKFNKDYPTSDDVRLEEAMLELGIVILGTDPNPPKMVAVTDAGAEEYDEIMLYYNDDL